MTTTPRRWVAVATTVLLVACATSGTGGRGSGNVVTYEELMATNEMDLYMAVQRLRPNWLRPRGQTSGAVFPTVVTLFIDGTLRGDVTSLREISLQDVVDVTYLSASEATFRFGTVAGTGGSLEVTTNH